LVKPQFEAGRDVVPGGVVRDPAVHLAVLERVVRQARALGLGVAGAIASPLLGPQGNREFLLDLWVGPTVRAEELGSLAAKHAPTPADLAERLRAITLT
jgi:23S rRNA (cytidine1920-2'-O)/16S rRNA (cytidine1409-2'-O)-methyltransferase